MAAQTSSQSSNFMVDIQTVSGTSQLSSDVIGFENYGPLYASQFSFGKIVAPDAAADLFASAQIQASSLAITIQNGIFVQDLQNTFISGSPIAVINLLTLGNINGVNQQVDLLTFNSCYILSLKAGTLSDSTAVQYLTVRYLQYTHVVTQYTQDGTNNGNNVATFNLATGSIG